MLVEWVFGVTIEVVVAVWTFFACVVVTIPAAEYASDYGVYQNATFRQP